MSNGEKFHLETVSETVDISAVDLNGLAVLGEDVADLDVDVAFNRDDGPEDDVVSSEHVR